MTPRSRRAPLLGLAAGLALAAAAFGAAPAASGSAAPAADPLLTLQLREVDLTHVFFVLNDLTGASFIVEPGVQGRLSLDLAEAPLEQALAAVRGAGWAVGPGPLHRVSRTAVPPAAPGRAGFTGEPVSTSLQDAGLTGLVCLLGGIPNRRSVDVRGLGRVSQVKNPRYEVLVPPDLQGRVSVFTTDLPWDQLLDGLLAPAGLVFLFDADGLWVGRPPADGLRSRPGAVDACTPTPTPGPGPTSPLSETLTDHDAASLELVGIARRGEGWKAYAYAAGRRLLSLEAGQTLRDATVTAVGPAGVVLKTENGKIVEVPLRPRQG